MQPSEHPIVFGAPYSVYVRAVRLALEEKGVHYELIPVDIFARGGPPLEHMARHPFGKIPAFEHAGFRLYEAGAITRYVDEAFPGPRLQPKDARGRARMNQIISILDSYAYRTLVWDIYVERVSGPANGGAADEQKIAGALPKAQVCLSALSELIDEAAWLAGPSISLADLHAAPIVSVFQLAPEGANLLGRENACGNGGSVSAPARVFFGPRCRRAMNHTRPERFEPRRDLSSRCPTTGPDANTVAALRRATEAEVIGLRQRGALGLLHGRRLCW